MGFSVQRNLSNTEPWDPSKVMEDLAAGLYRTKTVEVTEHSKGDGKKSIHFTFEVTEGPQKGKRGDIYLGLTEDEKGVNNRKLFTALCSHGAKADRIKAAGANLNITDAHFLGKSAYVLVKEASADAQEKAKAQGYRAALNDKEFLAPEQFAEMQKANAAVGGGNSAATPPTAAAPAGAAPDLFGS